MNPPLFEKLRKALKGRDAVELGRFQWLGLDLVRTEAGEDWPRLRRKVYDVSAHFIEKRLDDDDVVMRARGGFIVVFANADPEDSVRKAERISEELNAFFLGDRAFRRLRVRASADSVSTDQLMAIVSETDAKVVSRESAHEDAATTVTDDPDGAAWRAFGSHDDDLAPHWIGRGEGAGPDRSSPTRVAPDERREDPSHEAASISDVIESDAGAAPAADAPSVPIARVGIKPAYNQEDAPWKEVVFKPVWDAKNNVISCNLCLARRAYGGRYFYGSDVMPRQAGRQARLALDRSVAAAAQRAFLEAYREGRKCALCLSVSYETVRRESSRVGYFSILQVVPESMRKFFFLRVEQSPIDAPAAQLQEVFRPLRQFGSNVLVDLPLGADDLAHFESCGVGLFGAGLPARANEAGLTDRQLRDLSAQVTAAKRLGAESYLTSVRSVDTITTGVATGVRFFCGYGVADETPKPVSVLPLTLEDIFDRASAIEEP